MAGRMRRCPSTEFDPIQESNEIFIPRRTVSFNRNERTIRFAYIDVLTDLADRAPNEQATIWIQAELDKFKKDSKLMTTEQFEIFKEICV